MSKIGTQIKKVTTNEYCKDTTDCYELGIRYNELISSLNKIVQELPQKNDKLEEICSNLMKFSYKNANQDSKKTDDIKSLNLQASVKEEHQTETKKLKEKIEELETQIEELETQIEELEPRELPHPAVKSLLGDEIERTLDGYPCVIL